MPTSPITSNWFTYMTMSSIQKAFPTMQKQYGTTTNPLGTTPIFHLLLNDVMSTKNTNLSNLTNRTFLSNDLFHQTNIPLNTGLIDIPLANFWHTNDLQFKPTQFIKLDSMLKGKLTGTAMHFINAGKQYNIDPALLSAIAIHETGNGTSRAVREKLNVAGMMGRNGLRSYESLQDSIFDMARNLRENYINQGLDSIGKIGGKYAPIGATNDPTGLNNHWVNGVSKIFTTLT